MRRVLGGATLTDGPVLTFGPRVRVCARVQEPATMCDDITAVTPVEATGAADAARALHGDALALNDSSARMQRRCDASVSTLLHTLTAIIGAVSGEARPLRLDVAECVKGLDVALESARVSGAQLTALGAVLEGALSSGRALDVDVGWVRHTMEALCGSIAFPVTPFSVVRVPCPWVVLSSCFRVRYSVSGVLSVASGPGLTGYVCGLGEAAAAHNVFDVSVYDECGESVECEEGDVRVDSVGCVVRDVRVCVNGRVRVGYGVGEGVLGEVEANVSAFGTLLGGSPWTIVRVRDMFVYAFEGGGC